MIICRPLIFVIVAIGFRFDSFRFKTTKGVVVNTDSVIQRHKKVQLEVDEL